MLTPLLALALAVPGVQFDDHSKGRIVLTAPAYRLVLAKRNGAVLELVDRRTGRALLAPGRSHCLWAAATATETLGPSGCGGARFTYGWQPRTSTLTLRFGHRRLDAVATLRAATAFFDLRLRVQNRSGSVLEKVYLPGDLELEAGAVEAGYAPTTLPGVRLRPAFFRRVGYSLQVYPSRWAFADYLALDIAGGHLALSTANAAPAPLAPAELGFLRQEAGRCSAETFCLRHAFRTWIPPGSWTSPVVRIRVGGNVESSVRGYRTDNGIDRYPSLAAKLGDRLGPLSRSLLLKLDLVKGGKTFAEWSAELARLPSPALLHPVAFTPRGHDENNPDSLPPDPRFGTTADFRGTAEEARRRGILVMPYLNPTWWDDESPTLRATGIPSIALRDELGKPALEGYGGRAGVVVSPWAPAVRARFTRLIDEWRSDVPADCLFFDQLGAREWRRDFHPASPSPTAYYDGWLSTVAPFADRCLMVEDGWDRLAASFSAFHGSLLMLHREHDRADEWWGDGNWEPYPLAVWLFHDKVLLYQHDLYEGTLATDDEVLTWNAAFGLVGSWEVSPSALGDPRLAFVAAMQRALGPYQAGVPLTGYRELAPRVTESRFGGLTVVANWRSEPYGEIAAHGFRATVADGTVVAAILEGGRVPLPARGRGGAGSGPSRLPSRPWPRSVESRGRPGSYSARRHLRAFSRTSRT